MKIPLPQSFLDHALTHRGLHARDKGIIENSPSAVQAAIDAGYGIEIDIQRSKDGTAMVFHDDRMDRLTHERGLVRDFTQSELCGITLKDSTDKIETLAQILARVNGQVPLLIEIKDQSLTLADVDGTLEKAVALCLEDYEGDVAVMSFNPASVAFMAQYAPTVPRGLTTCDFAPNAWPICPPDTLGRLQSLVDYDDVEASFISHDHHDLKSEHIVQFQRRGDPILTWTIKSAAQEAAARHIANNITFEGYLAQSA